MNKPLNRTEITPKKVRNALSHSNISNVAVARELKIPISKVRDFKKGIDESLNTIERIKLYTLIKRGTF